MEARGVIEAIVGAIIILFCMATFGKTNAEIDEEEKRNPRI